MGSRIELEHQAYMGAALNPKMVEIEAGGCVGKEALLFGLIISYLCVGEVRESHG